MTTLKQNEALTNPNFINDYAMQENRVNDN